MKRPTDYTRSNLQAAAVILEDPEKHGGEESGLVRWARLVIQRRGRNPRARINQDEPEGAGKGRTGSEPAAIRPGSNLGPKQEPLKLEFCGVPLEPLKPVGEIA
jgi:hypothetical protein